MRSLRMATWTSGEPVSLSWVLKSPMRAVFLSFVSATVYLHARPSSRVFELPSRRIWRFIHRLEPQYVTSNGGLKVLRSEGPKAAQVKAAVPPNHANYLRFCPVLPGRPGRHRGLKGA